MSRTAEIRDAIIQARHQIALDEVESLYFSFFIFECGFLSASIGWRYRSWFLFIISLLIISVLFWIPVTFKTKKLLKAEHQRKESRESFSRLRCSTI